MTQGTERRAERRARGLAARHVLAAALTLAASILPTRVEAQAGLGLDAPAPQTDEVSVPPPPGAAPAGEARYPLLTPEETARLATADEAPSVRLSSRVTTRLRSLDAHLRGLAAEGGGNIVNAVLSLITGGLSITLGAVKDPNDDWLSIYLYVYGGIAAARGALDLILAPNASGPSIAYQHMPMTSRAEVEARLRYGETSLQALAEQAMIARILDASLNLAAGVAVVPLYLAPNDFAFASPLDYFVLLGAAVSVVSSVITLATSSSAEQRWSTYQAQRRDLEDEHAEEAGERPTDLAAPEAPVAWRVGGGPLEGGAYAGLSATF